MSESPQNAVSETGLDSENPKSKIQNPKSVVSVADVEDELNRRISALQTDPDTMILPARMSNLVIYCDREESAREIDTMLPRIQTLHPARVLLLVAQPEVGENALTTTLTVRAHRAKEG